jgi:hypothetical protein
MTYYCPFLRLHDAQREDIAFLVFQLWLLSISIVTVSGRTLSGAIIFRAHYHYRFLTNQFLICLFVAMFNYHKLTLKNRLSALVTHGLATAWSAFQISRTGHYMLTFESLVVRDACNGVDIIEGFWHERLGIFVSSLRQRQQSKRRF